MMIPNLKLDGLTRSNKIRECNRLPLGVDATHVSDQKVAVLKLVLILIDDSTNMQAARNNSLLVGRKGFEQFLNGWQGRLAANCNARM